MESLESGNTQLELFARNSTNSTRVADSQATVFLSHSENKDLYELLKRLRELDNKVSDNDVLEKHKLVQGKMLQCEKNIAKLIKEQSVPKFHIGSFRISARQPRHFLDEAKITGGGLNTDWNKISSDLRLSYLKILSDLIETSALDFQKKARKRA